MEPTWWVQGPPSRDWLEAMEQVSSGAERCEERGFDLAQGFESPILSEVGKQARGRVVDLIGRFGLDAEFVLSEARGLNGVAGALVDAAAGMSLHVAGAREVAETMVWEFRQQALGAR